MSQITYPRQSLIEHCEKSIVQQAKWTDRDSATAHKQLGEAWAMLKAGCEFVCEPDPDFTKMMVVKFWVHDFMWFEDSHDHSDSGGNTNIHHEYYMPTPEHLEAVGDGDWY